MEFKITETKNELAILSEISNIIKDDINNLEILFDNTAKEITKALGVFFCSIRLSEDNNKLQLKTCFGDIAKNIIVRDITNVQDTNINLAIDDNNNFILDKKSNASISYLNEIVMSSDGIKHISIIPIKLKQTTVGTITVGGKYKIDNSGISILNSVGEMISEAIDKIKAYEGMKELYVKSVTSLINVIEAKDIYTQGHSIRVSQYAKKIANRLKLNKYEIEEVEITGILHDIGKIGVSDVVLTKPDKLDNDEFEIIMQHPQIGQKILEPIGFTSNIINGALLHHKRFDLKGYPFNIHIKELPLVPRIIGAADAFDAMTSIRPYKKPMDKRDAMAELNKNAGTQFCPEIIKIMQKLFDEGLL